MLPACRAYPYTASTLAYSGRGLWFGYLIKNTHATNASTVDFYDGIGTGGVLIGSEIVPAVSSRGAFPSGGAVRTEAGLYINITAGTATVVPYYLTQTRLVTGLSLFDDEDRNLDELALARLSTWLPDLLNALTTVPATTS